MPTHGDGVGAALHDVAEHLRTIGRLEAELAAAELRRKAAALGVGAVLLAAGLLVAFFALAFLLATVAAAFATFLPTWLALLVVGAGLSIVTAVLVAVGVSMLRRGVPPVPEQAVREAKLTGAALKGNGRG